MGAAERERIPQAAPVELLLQAEVPDLADAEAMAELEGKGSGSIHSLEGAAEAPLQQ